MTPNELAVEKRIAAAPPVPDPETLEFPEPDKTLGHPPETRLLLEGFDPEEITAAFLVDVMDAADAHDLALDGISVRYDELVD